jgi:hypothetical protein
MKPRLTSSWLVLLILSIFNARQAAGLAQGVSFTTNAYSVGGNPTCVVAADANGDGKLDLISANYAGGILKLLTNNGNGGFGYNATFAVGQGPACVIAADVNGDGKFDLISANFGPPTISTNTLTILTNNGSGVFGSNATLRVGKAPFCVVAADIDGDGKLDLISANRGDGTLTVLTNNGSGVFGSNATLNVGTVPAWVVAADLNGDKSVDLVAANYTKKPSGFGNTLTVWTNNGNGVFGSNATLAVGSGPFRVAVADVNGDGKPDLISANYVGRTLTVLTNNGSGVFGFNDTLAVGTNVECVAVADVNGDGYPDLISANSGENTLTVLTNNGNGIFGFNVTLFVGNGPAYSVVADVNNDGKLDLISADNSSSTLTVLINTTIFPGPLLNIVSTADQQVTLSWPATTTNWTLESITNLSTTNWIAVTNVTSIAGSVTLSNTLPSVFFRLKTQ